MFTILSAKQKIQELENKLAEKDQTISAITTERDNAVSRAETAEADLATANSRVEAAEGSATNLQSQLDTITQENVTLQARVDGIDEEIKSKATLLANSHLASLGHAAIPEESGDKGSGVSDKMTENQFWTTYRAQPAATKNQWYSENKHLIGR